MPAFFRVVFQALWKLALSPTPTVSEADEREARKENVPAPSAPTDKGAPWMALARQEDGTVEDPGNKSNPKILAYFRDAGHPKVSDDETAWCAAFVNAMLERSGYGGTKLLNARSFMTWGVPLDKPRQGCVAVFARGNDGWSGHVGFYVGEDHDSVFVLGGNQRNPKTGRSEIVSVQKIPKTSKSLRLLGYRWPTTFKTSRTYKAGAVAVGSTATSVAAKAGATGMALTAVGTELKGAAEYLPILGLLGSVVALLAIGVMLYARWDDARNQGG